MTDNDLPLVDGYYPTIGIECHVQLKTKTKLFAGVDNDARSADPNTLISHICLGMPGALPVLNEKAIELASRAAFALNTVPSKFSKFDRKHYFYPDLPNGYQITQFDEPIVIGGHVEIMVQGKKKTVGVTRAHLEADAGKSNHPSNADYSLVDLNRAGTPLLEIVSEPDMHSPSEAKAYAKELYLLMRYADVSEANLFYGNMRFDVNVSVSKDPRKLGTRSETKNLNSFKSVEKAVEFEIKRQIELLKQGKMVVQETRGFDDAKQKTFSQRSKEDAHDYRYFPDPDLPPVIITDVQIDEIKNTMPVLPFQLRAKLQHLKLDNSVIETLVEHIPAGRFIQNVLESTNDIDIQRKIALWLATDVQSIIVEENKEWDEIVLDCDSWIKLANMVRDKELSSTNAKQLISPLINQVVDPMTLAKEMDLLQVADDGSLDDIVTKVISENAEACEDIKKGEQKAIGFLVGQVMKQSKGKADPVSVQKLIKSLLGV